MEERGVREDGEISQGGKESEVSEEKISMMKKEVQRKINEERRESKNS